MASRVATIDSAVLSLESTTPPHWVGVVESNLREVLFDHAHCEKKAAAAATHLLVSYVDRPEIVRALTPIIKEELDHLELVMEILDQRGWRLKGQSPSAYGGRLGLLVSKTEPDRGIDRILVSALIEARSCERFTLLAEGLADRDLAAFYGRLLESEARHFASYLRVAECFAPLPIVKRRLAELAKEEARIIALPDPLPRLHSTPER